MISLAANNTEPNSEGIKIMEFIKRTEGDGMENEISNKIEQKQKKCRLGETLIYHPTNLKQLSSIPPVKPMGPMINLMPKHVSNMKNEKHILNSLKLKEPKFVPYEPYKAAVNPIIPCEKGHKKLQKNKIVMNKAILQISSMTIQEPKASADNVKEVDSDNNRKIHWLHEKQIYEESIQKLKEENSQLECQLRFQAQVNAELKNLLVAAVGEDLETKVHLLTEDKLQLAQALLNSVQHLSTHQEQTEWLAGQCEVWRSKFLASSLMVEELAKWKAALCQKETDLQEAMKRLLEERNHIRDVSFKTYRMLTVLRENFDPVGVTSSQRHRLPSVNIVDLAEGCCQLAEILKVQLLNGAENIKVQKEFNMNRVHMKTVAEKAAEQLLMTPKLLMSGRQDIACSAVMGAAVAIGDQIFPPHRDSNITCCSHCSGEIKQI